MEELLYETDTLEITVLHYNLYPIFVSLRNRIHANWKYTSLRERSRKI